MPADAAPPPNPEQFRFQFQQAVIDVLATARTVEDAGNALLGAIGAAMRWDVAALWLAKDGYLECVEAWSAGDVAQGRFVVATKGRRLRHGEGLPGRVWEQGSAVWIADLETDPNFPRADAAREAHLRSGMALPIKNISGVVAVIECFSGTPQALQADMLAFADGIGKQIGQFLQRLDAERRMEENERRYAAIVHGALDAIIAIDADGLVTEFNRAAERLFGYVRAEVLGQEMAALLIPTEFREAHRAGLRRQRDLGESRILERRMELRACHRNGVEFPIELTISRFRVHGREGFIGFIRDITERQRHADEREALLVREREAHQAASSANRLKDEFLAALSHELRTPLNAILGWAHMLAQGTVPAHKVPQALEVIRRNAQAQQQIVDDMLDVSAFIAGRVRLEFAPTPLKDAIDAACESANPAARAKGVLMHVDVPHVVVSADRTRLQQVFWNLFGNAVKFTPPGGTVRAEGEVHAGSVAVRIRDTGEGIDPEFLPYVFDRFRQGADKARGGLGLGLAIVKQIVEAHGGTVSARSAGRGQGAEFIVELPLHREG